MGESIGIWWLRFRARIADWIAPPIHRRRILGQQLREAAERIAQREDDTRRGIVRAPAPYTVYCDGIEVRGCVVACPREGWADCHDSPPVASGAGILTTRIYGRIELVHASTEYPRTRSRERRAETVHAKLDGLAGVAT